MQQQINGTLNFILDDGCSLPHIVSKIFRIFDYYIMDDQKYQMRVALYQNVE